MEIVKNMNVKISQMHQVFLNTEMTEFSINKSEKFKVETNPIMVKMNFGISRITSMSGRVYSEVYFYILDTDTNREYRITKNSIPEVLKIINESLKNKTDCFAYFKTTKRGVLEWVKAIDE